MEKDKENIAQNQMQIEEKAENDQAALGGGQQQQTSSLLPYSASQMLGQQFTQSPQQQELSQQLQQNQGQLPSSLLQQLNQQGQMYPFLELDEEAALLLGLVPPQRIRQLTGQVQMQTENQDNGQFETVTDLKQLEQILVSTDYTFQLLNLIQCLNVLTFNPQVSQVFDFPYELINSLNERYFCQEKGPQTSLVYDYQMELNLSNDRTVHLKIYCLQNDAYKVWGQSGISFFMNPKRCYQNIPNYMSSYVSAGQLYKATDFEILFSSDKNVYGKQILFQKKLDSEGMDGGSDSDDSIDSDDDSDDNNNGNKLSKKKKLDDKGNYISNAIVRGFQGRASSSDKVISTPLDAEEVSEFENFKENVSKNYIEKILDLHKITTKIATLEKVITLQELKIKIINGTALTLIGKSVSLAPTDEPLKFTDTTTYFELQRVPHLSEVYEMFIANCLVVLNIDGYQCFVFLNVAKSKDLVSEIEGEYVVNKGVLRELLNESLSVEYKSIKDSYFQIEATLYGDNAKVLDNRCYVEKGLGVFLEDTFKISRCCFMQGIQVELVLESVIVYRAPKPNDINYKECFILSYSRDDSLETFRGGLENLITIEFGCEKGYFQLFDRKHENRIDQLLNVNIAGKTIRDLKELGLSMIFEDNSISFLVGNDFFLYQKQTSFQQLKEMAFNVLELQHEYIQQLNINDIDLYAFDESKSMVKQQCIGHEISEANFVHTKTNKFVIKLNKIFISFCGKKYTVNFQKIKHIYFVSFLKKYILCNSKECLFYDSSNMLFKYDIYNLGSKSCLLNEMDPTLIFNIQVNIGIYSIEFPPSFIPKASLTCKVTKEQVLPVLFKDRDGVKSLVIEPPSSETHEILLMFFLQNTDKFTEELELVRRVYISSGKRCQMGDYILGFCPLFLEKTTQLEKLVIQLETSPIFVDILKLQQCLQVMDRSFETMKSIELVINLQDYLRNKKVITQSDSFETSKFLKALSSFINLYNLRLRLSRNWYIGTAMITHLKTSILIKSIDFDWVNIEQQNLANFYVKTVNPQIVSGLLFMIAYKKHIMDYMIYIKSISHHDLHIQDTNEELS